MGVMAPRDLQHKDVTVTAQLGCNGALLPPSFQRVADPGVGGGGGRALTKTCERHPSGAGCRFTPLTPCLDRSGSESPEH